MRKRNVNLGKKELRCINRNCDKFVGIRKNYKMSAQQRIISYYVMIAAQLNSAYAPVFEMINKVFKSISASGRNMTRTIRSDITLVDEKKIVEVDSIYHYQTAIADADRDRKMAADGYSTSRIKPDGLGVMVDPVTEAITTTKKISFKNPENKVIKDIISRICESLNWDASGVVVDVAKDVDAINELGDLVATPWYDFYVACRMFMIDNGFTSIPRQAVYKNYSIGEWFARVSADKEALSQTQAFLLANAEFEDAPAPVIPYDAVIAEIDKVMAAVSDPATINWNEQKLVHKTATREVETSIGTAVHTLQLKNKAGKLTEKKLVALKARGLMND